MIPLASLTDPDARDHTRRQHDERRDLRRAIDVLTTGRHVACCNDRDGSGEEDGRGRCDASRPQPSTESAHRSQHREGTNAGEPRRRALGMSGPLALETDGRAAQRGDQQTDDVGCRHCEGLLGSALVRRNVWALAITFRTAARPRVPDDAFRDEESTCISLSVPELVVRTS